ncbi:MAG: hypothetical protein FWF08_04295 [Oscillospiraceae bacterium]|nr:hypothetical protein [Oscillospiraceae bacterium]
MNKKLIPAFLIFALIFTLAACGDVEKNTERDTANNASSYETAAETESADDTTGNTGVSETSGSAETTTEKESPKETAAAATAAKETAPAGTTAPPAQKSAPRFEDLTKEQIFEIFSISLNNVKIAKPGFTRDSIMQVEDIKTSVASSIVSAIQPILFPEKLETVQIGKGEPCDALFSPDGKDYAVRLSPEDIGDIKIEREGENYAITLTMPETVNPNYADSPYAGVFTVITLEDVMRDYVGKIPGATVAIENIKLRYHGCWAKATVNPYGEVIAYDSYVRADINVTDAKYILITGVVLDGVVSTTTGFRDFIW